MNFRSKLVFTIASAFIVHLSIDIVRGEKHKLLVQVPTHVKQHVHTVYKIVKVPVFVKESIGRNAHNEDHEHPHKVEHSGKFEHQHLHKHLHEHHAGQKADPLHHHHRHSVDGGIVVDHKHHGNLMHHYKGKVAHDNAGVVKHDHFGFVGHIHGGNVGHKHKGSVDHYHEGMVRHKHLGSVGHKHDGDVEHGHAGEVGHEHTGHVEHGHKGLIGHIHLGNVEHGHDGKVEHDHDGNVAHDHGAYVDHDHNSHTPHIYAENISHIQPAIVSEDHSNSFNPYQELSKSEAQDQSDEIQPIEKPGYYEYSIGLPGQITRSSFLYGSNSNSASTMGIEGITTSVGKAVGKQHNYLHADEVEDEAANEPDKYVDTYLLQQKPQKYEVFENIGL